MDRRTFLTLMVAAAACSEAAPIETNARSAPPAHCPTPPAGMPVEQLHLRLRAMFDPAHNELRAMRPAIGSLRKFYELLEINDYDDASFDTWLDEMRTAHLAHGRQVEIGGWPFAEVDLWLMIGSALLHQTEFGPILPPAHDTAPGMVKALPDVDLMGGDVEALAEPVSEDDCAVACLLQPECGSYTWAKPTHDIPSLRGRCWLKNGIIELRWDGRFRSGMIRR